MRLWEKLIAEIYICFLTRRPFSLFETFLLFPGSFHILQNTGIQIYLILLQIFDAAEQGIFTG